MDPRKSQPDAAPLAPFFAAWATPFMPQTLLQFPPQWPTPSASPLSASLPEVSQQALALYKGCLDTWLAMTNAALAGAERMRMAQLATDVETLGENHRAALGLAQCRDLPAVLAVQTGLGRAYLDGCARYWAAMAEAMQATQAEMARVVSGRAGTLSTAVPPEGEPAGPKERKAA